MRFAAADDADADAVASCCCCCCCFLLLLPLLLLQVPKWPKLKEVSEDYIEHTAHSHLYDQVRSSCASLAFMACMAGGYHE
jgi:hypothetical protein